jgi:hypothetical protein
LHSPWVGSDVALIGLGFLAYALLVQVKCHASATNAAKYAHSIAFSRAPRHFYLADPTVGLPVTVERLL